jgi:NAD(P)-dependent dehydrogenase (short-subunit alcohol dehydrogenase family)
VLKDPKLNSRCKGNEVMGMAMITGASGGLGKILARQLMDQGWSLVLVSRDPKKISNTLVENGLVVEADVSTPEGSRSAIEACIAARGEPPVALARAAGSVLLKPLHQTDPEQYRDCLRANLDSAFFMLGAFVDALLKERMAGSAVLVSTVAARIGVARHEAVAAAKAGIEGLVRSAAATYSNRNIRVNAIAPGLMRSPATERFFGDDKMIKQLDAQYPLGRHGRLEDGAAAMTWLLSDEAQWITGQVLSVDGGFTAVRPMVRA